MPLQRFNTNQFNIDREAAEFTLFEEASTLGMRVGTPYFHTIELVSQRSNVVIELVLDIADAIIQERERGDVAVFRYQNRANKIHVNIFND
jgi:hypothetical protein